MKIQKIYFAVLVISTMLSTSVLAQGSEGIDPNQIKWLHGSWKGVGFERMNISAAYENPVVKQTEFALSYDPSTQIITLTSQRQTITRTIRSSEGENYDRSRKRIELYDGGADDEVGFGTKLLIEFVSDGHVIFSLIYNRRSEKEGFIASGALMLTR
jgi:hypothetical protein